jgi:hypothetical protein
MELSLNDELSQIANTPQLERIATELERTSSKLYFSFELLLKLESQHTLTVQDEIVKAKLLDSIGKLILKL